MAQALPQTTILVVEDEVLIRFELIDMLEEAGFAVLDAGDADEAIVLLESRSEIRIVITDIQMPGSLDGLRLAHLIRNRWPPTHLLVMSGNLSPGASELPERASFVAKPFQGPALLRIIADLEV